MKTIKYIAFMVFAFFAVGMLDPVVAARALARVQALLLQIIYL